MKKITLLVGLIAFVLLGNTAFAQDAKTEKKSTKKIEMTFENTTHDFGTIEYDGDGSFDFIFRNTGKEPIIITDVKTSCGCTVPTWPHEPIGKRQTAAIKVKYDTKRVGSFTKTITVTSNAENSPITLNIKGTVVKTEK